jgi:hypothetical protein
MIGLLQRRILARVGTTLAMVALTVHLVLSFAHIHPLAGATPDVASHATHHSAPTAPLAPTADDSCAICANITAFSSVALPAPVFLGRAAPRIITVRAALSPRLALPPAFQNFQSRAPPSV